MIKAVLFDMDGVLIDAKDWHYEALNDALGLFGMEISRSDHLSSFDGLPTKRKLEILSQTHGLPRALHDFINEIKQRRTYELTIEHCRPMFHHQYALSRLKQEGKKIGVCSNSIKTTIRTMMGSSALAEYLDFFISNEDVNNPKPDAVTGMIVPVFESDSDAYSYLSIDNDEVIGAAEKVVISSHASAGVYVFRDCATFLAAAVHSLRNKSAVTYKDAFFICPMVNGVLSLGQKVRAPRVGNVVPIGKIFHEL